MQKRRDCRMGDAFILYVSVRYLQLEYMQSTIA